MSGSNPNLPVLNRLRGHLTLTSIITYTYEQPNSNTTTEHQISDRQTILLRSIGHGLQLQLQCHLIAIQRRPHNQTPTHRIEI